MSSKIKQYKELYVLMLGDYILTPDTFKEYWEGYGSGATGLYGWRPPKKIYYTLGQARRGKRYVPKEIAKCVKIHKFLSAGEVDNEQTT